MKPKAGSVKRSTRLINHLARLLKGKKKKKEHKLSTSGMREVTSSQILQTLKG